MLKTKSVKQELNFDEISNLVNEHNMALNHYIHLKDMYNNKNDIKNRVQQDSSKPNNKISHAYASYITDSAVGYFMGKPVSYSFNDETLAEQFDDIFKYNDETAENTQLATDASIFGCGAELLYVDSNLMPRFKAVSPLEVIAIYDCTIEENLIGGIRHWKVQVEEEELDYVEYYTANKIMKYTSDSEGKVVGSVETTEHYFGDIPLVVYENNHDCVGDFEKVVDLIDALDKVVSDSANDFEMFTNAIMVIKGVDIDEELFEKLKTMRLMNLVGDGEQKDVSAEYLYKDIPDQALENYKNRLVDNIHMFSGVPNMNDENFATNLSGVAIQFKLSNLEFKCATKESYFRKGLLRRIELICNLQGLMGKVGETKDIIKNVDIRFTRNVINNTNEMIQQAIQLSSIVSKETVLENLAGLIPDVQEELDRLAQEKEENIAFMQDNFDAHQPVEEDEEETWDTGSKDKDEEEQE